MSRLIDVETGDVLVSELQVADRFWPRFIGLQFRRSLAPDAGILLRPCSSIHTCFMRFAIDVVMLDKEMRIVGVRSHIKPWRAVICEKHTVSVLETIPSARVWQQGRQLAIAEV